MSQRLYVRYGENPVGTFERDTDSIMKFTYDDSWFKKRFPLSLALNFDEITYQGKLVESFFENLLPEGAIRSRLESVAGLPEGDDLAFLERFGEDCAGAFTVSPLQESPSYSKAKPDFLVSFTDIERAINEGLPVQTIMDIDGELPPFSLAGAQAKFPCLIKKGAVFLPRPGEPTSHIVKLPIRAGEKLLDSVFNEFLCMRLAALCGLNVPTVDLIGGKIKLFVVERFDRQQSGIETKRLHTQDFCQALGKTSREKYEKHGGPSFADCYKLIRENSTNVSHDLLTLLDWFAFNLAIGNNDSHAKNISLVLDEDGIKLAPFYDLVCTAIYPQYNAQFAFNIGDVNTWQKVQLDKVKSFAKLLGITSGFVVSRWLNVFNAIEKSLGILKAENKVNSDVLKCLRKLEAEIEKRLPELRKHLLLKK